MILLVLAACRTEPVAVPVSVDSDPPGATAPSETAEPEPAWGLDERPENATCHQPGTTVHGNSSFALIRK